MKKILNSLVFFSLIILASCGSSEDPAPPHIVGVWELESYVIINVPSTHSRQEGTTFQINELNQAGLVLTSYSIDIAADGTYIRKLSFQGGSPNQNDQGTWKLSTDGKDLTITMKDEDTGVDWSVEKDELDQLWITEPSSFSLISNATIDQLFVDYGDSAGVNEHLNSLTDEAYALLFDNVSIDLLNAFARK